MAPVFEYHLTYLGHVVDAFDTIDDAREGRTELVKKIMANEIPDFLDADDIEGEQDFDIRRVPVFY